MQSLPQALRPTDPVHMYSEKLPNREWGGGHFFISRPHTQFLLTPCRWFLYFFTYVAQEMFKAMTVSPDRRECCVGLAWVAAHMSLMKAVRECFRTLGSSSSGQTWELLGIPGRYLNQREAEERRVDAYDCRSFIRAQNFSKKVKLRGSSLCAVSKTGLLFG